ncbi:bZIP transcription factor [Colletotrichum scovillei]|uniref:bZIP transcription factor n=1 Tax=Colletotrichum scovillei TaxID=1209932 RepID=UPI0015C405E6|nr:bZIP transcription factor [Colletotrichum scovillei]KAF4774059.1 bZIP transcription factor [Colletotrichum scovillei]
MCAASSSAAAADNSSLPGEVGLIHDLQHQHQQQSLQLSAAGLPGTDFGLFGPDSVHIDSSLPYSESPPWDTLPWTSAAYATPSISTSPLGNPIDQSFPLAFIDTSPPVSFDTFPDTFLPVQLDALFESNSSSNSNSNSNSPNQPPPLDMSVYTATSGLHPHRSLSNDHAQGQDVATPHTDKILRRQRNTIAARKYRQKKVDRIDELESLLKEMTRERDDLRIRLVRQEAETEALKSVMRKETKP